MASEKAESSGKRTGGIMALLPMLLGTLAVISAGLLFAGLYDVGHFGLGSLVKDFAVVPVAVFVLCAIPAFKQLRKSGGAGQVADESVSVQFDELRTTTNSRLMNFQSALDAMTGQDRESLLEENKWLKEQLDEFQNAERQKVVDEVEKLRSQNAVLEEKIKEWAIQTVDSSIAEDKPRNLNAA